MSILDIDIPTMMDVIGDKKHEPGMKLDGIILYPSEELHESGWRNMLVIGRVREEVVSVISTASDLLIIDAGVISIDCTLTNGIHLTPRFGRLIIEGQPLSTVFIKGVRRGHGKKA